MDVISRQAAIDLVRDICNAIMCECESHYDDEVRDEVYEDVREVDAILKCNKRIRKALRNLPSAQPEQRWIPVSEKLPEYGEKCLVDFKLICGTSHRILTSYCYVQKRGFWSDTPFQYKAIAWMPLPDLYKE